MLWVWSLFFHSAFYHFLHSKLHRCLDWCANLPSFFLAVSHFNQMIGTMNKIENLISIAQLFYSKISIQIPYKYMQLCERRWSQVRLEPTISCYRSLMSHILEASCSKSQWEEPRKLLCLFWIRTLNWNTVVLCRELPWTKLLHIQLQTLQLLQICHLSKPIH